MRNAMNNWSASRRRALIGVVVLAMLLIPASRIFREDIATIERVRGEAAGLQPAWAALQLVHATQEYRGIAHGTLLNEPSLAARRAAEAAEMKAALSRARDSIDGLRVPSLHQRVAQITTTFAALSALVDANGISVADSYRRLSALIDMELLLVDEIADATGITAHADMAGNRLHTTALRHAPLVAERLSRLRGEGTRLLSLGQASREERLRLAALSGEAGNRMQDARAELERSGLSGEGRLAETMAAAVQAAEQARRHVDNHILMQTELATSAPEFFAAMTQSIDRQYDLIAAAFEVLEAQIEGTRSDAVWHLVLDVTGTLALAAFGIWLLGLATRSQRAREASDARSRAMVDASPVPILNLNADASIAAANPAAKRMFGESASAGGKFADLFAERERPGALAALAARYENAAANDATRDITGVRADGTTFDAELLCFGIDTEASGKAIAVVRDVSERRQLETQLRQSQKLEAVGHLMGGLAHDFNNMLGVIVGNLDLLERDVAALPRALTRVQAAIAATMRSADLTRQLLAFARRQHLEPVRLQLAECIANAARGVTRTLGPDIHIESRIAPDTPDALADASGLDNVLLNLLTNAGEAMPEGGTITIEAAPMLVDGNHPAVKGGELQPGKYVRVRITDTGAGIAPEHMEKVFEPFYTTKKTGKGAGLGLAMVYGFVKQSGGHVKLYSEPGFGTSVSMILPVADANARMPAVKTLHVDHRARPGARALVVDDEPQLREVAATYLRDMGYEVETAADGPDALRVHEGLAELELLVTDVIMSGGMNGVALSRQLRERRPGLRVVFTSGFPADALSRRDSTRVDGPLVGKPYQRHELSAAVSRTMERQYA
jgi:PAS domain S-box-containing protein